MVEFIWDNQKELTNLVKHGVDFRLAAKAFLDPDLRIFVDKEHSINEERFFCIGKVDGEILTVRFTYREGVIRIFGAGY
jgi:hypothetical protein